MKITRSGEFAEERKLTIEADGNMEVGFMIDEWHKQIIEHMGKLKLKTGKTEDKL